MSIACQCPNCSKKYKVPDKFAGKRVKCKECGTAISIRQLQTTKSKSGDRVLRHQPSKRAPEPVAGGGESAELISAHFEELLGQPQTILHELVSSHVHLDVIVFEPKDDLRCYTLVTSGMSDQAMAAPPEAAGTEFAELMLMLPEDWPMSKRAWKQNEAETYWPIRWLKQISRLPHEYDTWVGSFHTIPNGDPAEPFGPNTDLCCWILMPMVLFPEELWKLDVDFEKQILFHLILPLYQEEVDFKLERGAEELFGRLMKLQPHDLWDFQRRNVCKKRFGIF